MLELKNSLDREIETNRIALAELSKAITNKVVFAFVGGGCSNKLHYPTWPELIKKIESEVKGRHAVDLQLYKNSDRCTKDYLWYAEILKGYLIEQEFYELMDKEFKPKANMDSLYHQKLITIPFRNYITTNYDVILEHASYRLAVQLEQFCWRDEDTLKKFFQELNDANSPRSIFHIHGIYNRSDSIVLTEKDYLGLYFEQELVSKVLWSIVSTFRMCFLGFSMDDLDLLSIFRKSRWDFGRGKPRHFTLFREDRLEARISLRVYMRDKYGIDPIFYSKQDGENPYVEEENLIDELVKINAVSPVQKTADGLSEMTRINLSG